MQDGFFNLGYGAKIFANEIDGPPMEYALYVCTIAALVAGGFLYIRREIRKPPSLFFSDTSLTCEEWLQRYKSPKPDSIEGYGRLRRIRPDGTTYCHWYKPTIRRMEAENKNTN